MVNLEVWMFAQFKKEYLEREPKRHIRSKIAFQHFKEWLAMMYPEMTAGELYGITYERYINTMNSL